MISETISVFIGGSLQVYDYRRSQTDHWRRNPRAAGELRNRFKSVVLSSPLGRCQVMLKKTECVWYFNHAHPSRALLLDDLIAQGLHSRPVHLWPEVMFGVVTVIKPSPVVKLVVRAHAPSDRLIRVAAVMTVIAVQIRQAMAKVPKRQKKTDVVPVQHTQDNKSCDERC